MKKQQKSLWLCIAAFAGVTFYPKKSQAQIPVNSATLLYTQTFNTLDTITANSSNLPPGWQIFEYGSSTTTVNNQYKGNQGSAATGDTYSYGSPGSTDRALGSIATSGNREMYGAKFINNTGVNITSIFITYRGEQWRRGTTNSDTLQFRYSTTALSIADTALSKWTIYNNLTLTSIYSGSPASMALDGNATGNFISKSDTIPVNVLPGDTLLIEWVDKDVNGSDDGLAIDDLSILFITDAPPIPNYMYIKSKSPEGQNIDPATNQMLIKFDHLIEQSNGQISIYKNGNATPVNVSVPSSQITITDSTAIISSILLENNSQYYIELTVGSFKKAGGNILSAGITNQTDWAFSTADTVVIRPFTSLNESFQNCMDTAMGVFKQYNVEGFKTWRCAATGHDDNAAVSMSGGITDGISDSNTDWLISQRAFDFLAMVKPELSFWHKARFAGNATRSLKISTDYISGKNPATATWTTLQIQDMIEDPSEDWMPVADIDLTPYKHTPFFLAFTYSCGEHGAYELSYDDIKVQDETLGIITPKLNNLSLQIIGEATANAIHLGITTSKPEIFTLEIFNLIGKSTYKKMLKTHAGRGIYVVNDAVILPDIYFIRLYNEAHYDAVKVLIR